MQPPAIGQVDVARAALLQAVIRHVAEIEMTDARVDTGARHDVAVLDHIEVVVRDAAEVERIRTVAGADQHGVEQACRVSRLHDVGPVEEAAIVSLTHRARCMAPQGGEQG